MQSLSEKRSEIRKITHNPEVSGSNPLPATQKTLEEVSFLLVRIPSKDCIQSPLPDQQHLKSCLFGNKETEYMLEDRLLRILIICKLPY